MKPFLGDQLASDREDTHKIEYSPKDDEPHLNCYMDVTADTPDGEEVISYMLVDGAYVRGHVFVDYVEGGHFYRYGWIPEDQIWLEDVMSIMDQVCTGVHETHERFRMKYKGWDYERAHASACVIERKLRGIAAEPDTILPPFEGLREIFELEASGEDCEKLAKELFHTSEEKATKANEQSMNSVGKQEFEGLKEN